MISFFDRIKFTRKVALIEEQHLRRQPILDVILSALLKVSFLGPERDKPRLNNEDTAKLAVRLPESVVVRVVELYQNDFDMSQAALLNLRNSGIGNGVVDAMLSRNHETIV